MAIASPAIFGESIRTSRTRGRAVERNTSRPAVSACLIALGDSLAVALALTVSVLARHAFHGNFELSQYFELWPMLALFPAAYALFGLYPGILASSVLEIRRTAAASTAVFLILAQLTFLLRVGSLYSRLVFLAAWAIALVAVPLTRAAVRGLFARKSWWGYPAVVLGDGPTEVDLLRKFLRQPQCGLRPIAMVASGYPEGSAIDGVPVFESLEEAGLAPGQPGVAPELVALSGMGRRELAGVLRLHATALPRLLLAPGLDGISSLDVQAKDVCQSLMLESRNRLLLPWPRRVKRVLDFVVASAAALAALPLAAAIAVAVRLESRGPAFYRHARIGRSGQRIVVWKFRTMVANADEVLNQYLRKHPELAAEWQLTQKLKNDPRVTRFGRLLRQFSLDELPQLWNVLRGDMSMVGPRPIVTGEIAKYRQEFASYTRVRPGLTGLWQVSGRSDVSFDERVGLDTYYVRNWSPWLDIYVLARTVSAVLSRAGAY